MKRDFAKSIVLHICILVISILPIFKSVKREIVPSHSVPVIFDKIEKEAPPQKQKPKLKKKKPAEKPEQKIDTSKNEDIKKVKEEIKKNTVKIPDILTPTNKMKKKDFSSLIEEIKIKEPENNVKQFDSVLKDLTPEEYKEDGVEEIEESLIDKLKDSFSIAEEDALRSQIMNNWLVPIGAKNIETMEVDIKIKVAKGGKIISTEIIKNKFYQRANPTYEVFVKSAKNAVLKSSPLKLSQERMEIENEIVFHFAPTDMF